MVLLPIAAFLFYSYILHVHMNGRSVPHFTLNRFPQHLSACLHHHHSMVDVYYRLNVDEVRTPLPLKLHLLISFVVFGTGNVVCSP